MTTLARDAAREADLRRRLAGAPWTFSPFCVDEADSTMTVLAALAAEGAPEGTVVLAERQTAGRGRFDRAWASPPGGLYLSLLVRPRPSEAPAARGLYGLVTSLALLDAVEAVAPGRASLKWPNDLLAGGRKLAGLLSAAGVDGRGAPFVGVGVGVNVATRAALLPAEAATLADLAGRPVDIDALVLSLLRVTAERIERLRALGEGPALREWLQRSGWTGRRVRVATDARHPLDVVEGRVVGLGPAGALVVEDDRGRSTALDAGDATLVEGR
jgi:BirA family biotin operon repressor/biotin-[acetyl-CoA-carboxylase] ligase